MKNKNTALNLFIDPDILASAKVCNRCGVCNQSCPVHRVLQGETTSPRGRNQLLRFLTDKKINKSVTKKDILAPALGCLMCGQCAAACAAGVSAAKHMTAIKRALDYKDAGNARALFLNLYNKAPSLRAKKTAMHNALYLPGAHTPAALKIATASGLNAHVLKSGRPLAEIALTMPLATLKKTLDNIKADYEAAGNLPLITDEIDIYRIIKSAPEISPKYQALADNITFITQLIKKNKINTAAFKGQTLLLQNNNIFFCQDNILQDVLDLCGGKLLSDPAAHSAGKMPYCGVKAQKEVARAMARAIAVRRADIFITLSSADKTFYKKLLSQYYPNTKVMHITEFLEACGPGLNNPPKTC